MVRLGVILIVFAIAATSTTSSAGTPSGRYELEYVRSEQLGNLPSCGARADAFLRSFTQLEVVYSKDPSAVVVNGTTWRPIGHDKSLIGYRHAKDAVITLVVETNAGTTSGWIVWRGYGPGPRAICGDVRRFDGRYVPPTP